MKAKSADILVACLVVGIGLVVVGFLGIGACRLIYFVIEAFRHDPFAAAVCGGWGVVLGPLFGVMAFSAKDRIQTMPRKTLLVMIAFFSLLGACVGAICHAYWYPNGFYPKEKVETDLSGVRVLFALDVDDVLANRAVSWLRQRNLQVTTANTSESAKEALGSHPFDLFIEARIDSGWNFIRATRVPSCAFTRMKYENKAKETGFQHVIDSSLHEVEFMTEIERIVLPEE